MMPSTGAVTSKLALSVSTSAITSPAATGSPLCFSQAVSSHSSTVFPGFGISTDVATEPDPPCQARQGSMMILIAPLAGSLNVASARPYSASGK